MFGSEKFVPVDTIVARATVPSSAKDDFLEDFFVKRKSRRRKALLLVGEAGGLFGDGEPFGGRIGRRMSSLLGMSPDEFLRRVERVNLLARSPGRQPAKGHLFPLREASVSAASMPLTGRVVVLAGKRVARAFGLTDPPWLTPVVLGRGEALCAVMPHPSGIVRWWNDAGNADEASRCLRRMLDAAEGRS